MSPEEYLHYWTLGNHKYNTLEEAPMIKESKTQAPVCPACGSRVCYYRQKTKDFICRRCGHIGKRDKFIKRGEQ